GRADLADWFYLPAWRLTAAGTPAAGESPRRHLVFLDDTGVGASLAERLEERGHEVFTVRKGTGFERLPERAFIARPGEREDCDRLLASMAESGGLPERIVYLWPLTVDGGEVSAAAMEQQTGFHALAALAQALEAQALEAQADLAVEARREVALTVVASGLHNVRCRSVDVVAPPPASPAARRLTAQLLTEVAAEDADPVVAYRGERRWRRGVEPLSLRGNRGTP